MLSSIKNVSLGYWISRKNSLELIEQLSSINKVSLV